MWAERRSPTFRLWEPVNPRGEEPVPEAKPYVIPKQLVWDAYQRVKANRGPRVWTASRWRYSKRT